ncbi:hypothetical protein ACFXHA_29155 [Nocardia sp. NPDC059240]|uniref:hypothetical protein n=1 Tax=Nocardia sp. NPDC059240 TaxID=3346786 RepID=UPI0036D06362
MPAQRRWTFIRKPVVWFAALIVAAAGTAVTGIAGKYITKGTDRIGADIHVIEVDATVGYVGSVVVPANTDLTGLSDGRYGELVKLPGAVRIGEVFIRITISATRSTPVKITNITPVVAGNRCDPPLEEGWGMVESGGGGDSSLTFSTRIDDPRPTLDQTGTDNAGKTIDHPDYFDTGGLISLPDNETDVLYMRVSARQGYCRFTYRVDYVGPSGPRSMTIDNHGQPFAVTSAVGGGIEGPAAPGDYSWTVPHFATSCHTSNGRLPKLTHTQLEQAQAVYQSGGYKALAEFCAPLPPAT